MDSITLLATTTVSILSPYFAKAVEAATKKLGEDLYQFLKTYFQNKDNAKEALEDLKEEPNNPDFQASLRVQLKKLLAIDDEFANELARILGKEDVGYFTNNFSGDVGSVFQMRDNYGDIEIN